MNFITLTLSTGQPIYVQDLALHCIDGSDKFLTKVSIYDKGTVEVKESVDEIIKLIGWDKPPHV
jgi:hypothetical protein